MNPISDQDSQDLVKIPDCITKLNVSHNKEDKMMFLPLLFNVKYHKVTIIGGGKIALRKAKKVIEYGGEVICISPKFEKEFFTLKNTTCLQKHYDKHLLSDGLVIAATDNSDLNTIIYNDCRQLGSYCLRVDNGQNSDFIFSAGSQTEDMIISVSTKGADPSKAKKVLEKLMAEYERISKEIEGEEKYEDNSRNKRQSASLNTNTNGD